MKTRVKLFFASLALLLVPVAALPATSAVADTPKQTVCDALQAGTDCTTQPPNSVGINSAISAVINLLSFLVGIVAVIMIIVGGFKYVTSGGDSAKITSAKNTLLYAVIGVIVAALAQVIVKFVLSKLK